MVDDAIKDKYVQFKQIETQIEEISDHLDTIEQQRRQLHNTKEALGRLSDVGLDDEILIPLAAGMWLKGKATDTSQLLVNVGKGVTVPRSIEESVSLVDEQLEQLATYEKRAVEHMQQLSARADEVNEELAKLEGH